MKLYILLSLLLNFFIGYSQTDTLIINEFKFITKKQIFESEYFKKIYDTAICFYRIENEKPKYLLKHYTYRSSADGNNEFVDIGSYIIQGDSLIFTTIYKQKTGKDPIPEKRKQIYIVKSDGRLYEVFDKELQQNGEWELVPDNRN